MGSDTGTRVRRVAEGVREELASLIAHEVRDPGAAGAIVTRVEMTSDLRLARVHIRLLHGGDAEQCRRTVVEALGRASGMLRRQLTRRLSLRFAPELRFHYDEGLDKTTRIEEILVEITRERRSH